MSGELKIGLTVLVLAGAGVSVSGLLTSYPGARAAPSATEAAFWGSIAMTCDEDGV
jgi:hypothetical protein